MIPKIVYYTHENIELANKYINIIYFNYINNPELKFKFYDNISRGKFIKKYYPDFYNFYENIHYDYGAVKADIFRVLILYHYGGIYIDIKTRIKDIYKIIQFEPFCCGGYDDKVMHNYNKLIGFKYSNFFISTEKKGKIISLIKNEMYKRLSNYGKLKIPLNFNFLPGTNKNGMKCVYYYTGPGLFNYIISKNSNDVKFIRNKKVLNYDINSNFIKRILNHKIIYNNRYHISKNNLFIDNFNFDFSKLTCMENRHCYYYKYIKQKNGLFENIVDAVFILLMEGSKREENIFKQLNKYNLHSNIIIQYNKGFKSCKKKLMEQKTVYDLVDAFKQVFIYSKLKNYKNILILEDDFIITENIKKKDYIKSIKKIIDNDKYHILNLGGPSILDFKYNKYIDRTYINWGAQAIIYNKSYYNKFLNSNLREADQFLYSINKIKKYNVNIPIIIQPIPMTENRKNWKIDIIQIVDKILNIDWNKNYEGFELKYWNKYFLLYRYISTFIKLILLIIFIYILFIINKFLRVYDRILVKS